MEKGLQFADELELTGALEQDFNAVAEQEFDRAAEDAHPARVDRLADGKRALRVGYKQKPGVFHRRQRARSRTGDRTLIRSSSFGKFAPLDEARGHEPHRDRRRGTREDQAGHDRRDPT